MRIYFISRKTPSFLGGVHAAFAAHAYNPHRALFARLEMVFWMYLTSQSFVTVFLQSKGINSVGVGIVMAANALVGLVALPFWGLVSDRIGSPKKAFFACLIFSTLFIALVPSIGGYTVAGILLLIILTPAIEFFRLPCDSLANCWIVQTTQREEGLDFGWIRMWGSLGYALMAATYYFLIRWFGLNVVFLMPLLCIGPMVFYLRKLPDTPPAEQPAKRQKLRPARLLRNYYYAACLLFLFLLSISKNAVYIFRTFLILSVGGSASVVGLIVAFQVLFEIPAIILSRRLLLRLRPTVVLCMVGFLYVAEHFLYTVCTSTFQIMLIQGLEGFANGINTVALINYIHTIAPEGLKSTAQSLGAMAMTAGGVVASLFGGWAVGALGIRTLYLLTGANTLGAVLLFMLSFAVGERLFKKRAPIPLFVQSIRIRKAPPYLRRQAALAMVWIWLVYTENANRRHTTAHADVDLPFFIA